MMNTSRQAAGVALASMVLGSACAARQAPQMVPERELTAGLVQRDVRAGTDAARVAETLGSPNIVTRDAEGREVWIYDRVASERVERARSAGLGAWGLGTLGSTLLQAAGGAQASDSTVRTSQKTLTVVVRFNSDARVESVSLHASRF